MIAGRSKQVLKTWMAQRDRVFRDREKVGAMDGFTGFKTAPTEELPKARIVMDPFHVVRLGRGETRPLPHPGTTGVY